MKTLDKDSLPEPLNKGSLPRPNVARKLSLALCVGAFAFIVIYLFEFLLFRFCNDQVITKSFQVVRVALGFIWVTIWVSYEIERRNQFFSKRI